MVGIGCAYAQKRDVAAIAASPGRNIMVHRRANVPSTITTDQPHLVRGLGMPENYIPLQNEVSSSTALGMGRRRPAISGRNDAVENDQRRAQDYGGSVSTTKICALSIKGPDTRVATRCPTY